MKVLRLLRQKRVLAGFVDDVVETFVRIVVGISVLLRCLPNAVFVRFLELLLHGLGDPPGRQGPAHALESGHDLEPFNDVFEAERGNEGASSCLQFNQSGRGKLHQGFPDWCPGYLETSCEALLVKPITRAKLARHNVLFEGVP